MTTTAATVVPAPSLTAAPWSQSATHADAVEPSRPGDDELARHVLRILIAEARREGLEL